MKQKYFAEDVCWDIEPRERDAVWSCWMGFKGVNRQWVTSFLESLYAAFPPVKKPEVWAILNFLFSVHVPDCKYV